MEEERTLNASREADARNLIDDLVTTGDPFKWKLVCKASSIKQGWMKSTKAFEIPGVGCLVQVTTRETESAELSTSLGVAEALVFVPMVGIMDSGLGDGSVEFYAIMPMGNVNITTGLDLKPDYLAQHETP